MQKFEKDYKAYLDRYTAWMVEQFYLKNGQSETRQEFAERFEAGNGKTPQRASARLKICFTRRLTPIFKKV